MATGRVPTTANSPLTAKGDLFGYSTTQARVAVGSDGDSLVADSSATTGLRWQSNFTAGKNKIINGDFNINQRGFSSTTTNQSYGFDRWMFEYSGGTTTYSSQSFTAGSAPVAGYEAKNFARLVTSSQSATSDYAQFIQRIEDVRTFANQTITISFWAKANSGTPSISAEWRQFFGTGGSTSVFTPAGKVTISTSWARYSLTVNVPSISGKTIGTAGSDFTALDLWVSSGSDYNTRSTSLGIQNNTFDFWGVQVEAGSVATAFQTATGTLAGELAACQRYYYRTTINAAYGNMSTPGFGISTTQIIWVLKNPVTMRVPPTSIDYGGAFRAFNYTDSISLTSIVYATSNTNDYVVIDTTTTGVTQYRPYVLNANNNSSTYWGVSAEL